MGRGKIDIKLIENINNRQVTFSKRRGGLVKKARELSILCDAEVAVIVFSSTGKLFEFSSKSMEQTLSRYNKRIKSSGMPLVEKKPKQLEHTEVEVLSDEISKLKSKQLLLLGKDLKGMGLNELRELEHQLHEGLVGIKSRKDQILMEQLEHSRKQEELALLENDQLRKEIEGFRGFYYPLSATVPAPCIEFYPTENNVSSGKDGVESQDDIGSDGGFENENSDTTLQLGLATGGCQKRKTPEPETHSTSSGSHLELK
ncbi:PREDICTED: MADS-box transcription factor 23-like isoform X2 [Ipomoea nil]|uniref:MADS-box transcription factor 23-like isoform X2 n=1 Tax=Ipomoea nil TaxID=35883 RepID=UPI0009010F6B|nr:PREDICTED: MADS-box transcription factor 23-like isoform X2 [Ipomoea nil]